MSNVHALVTPNVITAADLLDVAQELGKQAGQGKDTQVKFLLKVLEGAYHNAIDLAGNKHGKDIDDATKLVEAYVKAQSGATVFDHKAPNQRKTISCARTMIKFGQWTKGGNGEPIASANNLMTMRQKLRQNPTEAKKLDDAANTLLKQARTQLKRDTLLTDEELRQLCYKKPKGDAPTAEERLESTRKLLDKLIKGDLPDGAQDNSSDVIVARDSLTRRLIAIAKAKGTAKQGGTTLK